MDINSVGKFQLTSANLTVTCELNNFLLGGRHEALSPLPSEIEAQPLALKVPAHHGRINA
jgi:hypothetical protein